MVNILEDGAESFKAYWNEGAKLVIKTDISGLKVEARHRDLPDRPIAAVSGTCGRGKVALLGFHPEFGLTEPKSEDRKVPEERKKSADLDLRGSSTPSSDPDQVKRTRFMEKMLRTVNLLSPS